MLPGISGTLITPAFLDRVLIDELTAQHDYSPTLRHLQRWWRRVTRMFGPASSARVIADAGAIPLFEDLGYHVLHLEPHAGGFVGILSGRGHSRIALRVAAWGDDLD